MRFSKWHALGNAYLLVERADLARPFSPQDARDLCDAHRGVGADGVVWNPDGSRAELSGNGARIAAMWLARRSGVAFPRVRLGERTIPARVQGDDVEVDLGTVEVARPEVLDVEGERLEFTPVWATHMPCSGASPPARNSYG